MARLSRRSFALLLLAAALAAAAASAQPAGISIRLDPNLVGRPSTLIVEAEGQSGQSGGPLPRSAVISIQRGFKLDPRARAKRCSARQASNFACPAASRIGGGRAVVTARGAIIPGGSQDFTASIDLYLAPPPRRGDLAGVVVAIREPTTNQRGTSTGRLRRISRGPYGYELRFGHLSTGQAPPPGITVELKRLDLHAGAHRTITRGGRRITYHLITNPSACDGTWNGHAAVTFSDGSSQQTDLSSHCRRR